jgi:hypothetical protein
MAVVKTKLLGVIKSVEKDQVTASATKSKTKAKVALPDEAKSIPIDTIAESPEIAPDPKKLKKVIVAVPKSTVSATKAKVALPDVLKSIPIDTIAESSEITPDPKKPKKVIAPVPSRTQDEFNEAIANYKLLHEPTKIIPSMVGKVADNISLSQQGRIKHGLYQLIKKSLIDRLLLEPELIQPTWEVLINNDLAVRKKNDTLLKLGWEPQLPKSDRLTFIRICALARILEMGVLEVETLDVENNPPRLKTKSTR